MIIPLIPVVVIATWVTFAKLTRSFGIRISIPRMEKKEGLNDMHTVKRYAVQDESAERKHRQTEEILLPCIH